MELLVGFIFGVVASLIASYIFTWLTPLLSLKQQKQIKVYISKPLLFVRLLRHTDERRIKDRIVALFEAWTTKSPDDYLSCWADNAVRLPGPSSEDNENKEMIERKFRASCQKYSVIKVSRLVIENIIIDADKITARANVYYRFDLTRADHPLTFSDESREAYILKKTGGVWSITANIDYYLDLLEAKVIKELTKTRVTKRQ
jgi:hypothetical protein